MFMAWHCYCVVGDENYKKIGIQGVEVEKGLSLERVFQSSEPLYQQLCLLLFPDRKTPDCSDWVP